MGVAYAWPHVAKSADRRASKDWQIGILVGQAATDPEWVARFEALTKGLRELGCFEIRHAVGHPDQFSSMAAELVSARVDVLVVAPAGLAVIARRATSAIPIIVMSAGDLETTGLVASVSKPGGNVTGFQLLNPELMSKRLDLLHQFIPNLSRIGLLQLRRRGSLPLVTWK